MFTSNEVFISDFTMDYFPFAFAGYGGEGRCFLRVRIHKSNVLVLCAQLPNYHSTSVTNGLESIIDALVAKLMAERKLSLVEGFARFSNLLKGSKERERTRFAIVRQQFLKRCRWFEHYPPGVGLASEGSWSLVTFNESGSPSWSYGSQEYFENEYPRSFFKIDVNLESWITQRH
jgi:hypothetical protein